MPSGYPGSLDNFATNKSDSTTTLEDHAPHHNDLADAVNKIESALGVNPQDGFDDVAARLAAIPERITKEVLASNANSFPVIVLPSGITRIRGYIYVVGVATSVARLRLGGSAIDSGSNYANQSFVPSSTTATTSTATNGMPLQHTTIASGNHMLTTFELVKPSASLPARLRWWSNAVSASAATAPTTWHGSGIWVNTSDSLERLQVLGFSTLTGTTSANLGSGSELVIFGS